MPGRLVFLGRQSPTSIAVEMPGAAVRTWRPKGVVSSAARCGQDIVVADEHDHQMVVERFGADGRFIASLTPGPWDAAPGCSPDGSVLFFLRQAVQPGVVRCDPAGCRRIVPRQGVNLAVAPDGERIVFVVIDGAAGPTVVLADADGGRVRELAQTETACQPGWASKDRVWVSRRRSGKIVWTELDVASGTETGRYVPGSRDCADGRPDPQSPVDTGVRVIGEQISQIRVLDRRYLQ
jgi:dipeptidyl aminopeptidase/acylaminoacyl peptidase